MAPRNDMTSTLCDTARPFDSRGTPAVTATELVAKLAETHGVSKAQAKSIVDDIFKDIVDERRGDVAAGVREVQSQGDATARRAQSG